jgi:hypothetical protein
VLGGASVLLVLLAGGAVCGVVCPGPASAILGGLSVWSWRVILGVWSWCVVLVPGRGTGAAAK